LILSLNGPAITGQIDTIYKYDQDTNSDIFIPYAYIQKIDMINKGFSILMSKTFSSNKQLAFTIVPTPDAFGTNLCECQLQMFKERLMENYLKRTEILGFIVTQIVSQINEIKSIVKNIKTLESKTIDKKKINILNLQSKQKNIECTNYENIIKAEKDKKAAKDIEFSENIAKDAKALEDKDFWEKIINRQNNQIQTDNNVKIDESINTINDWIFKLGETLRNPPSRKEKFVAAQLEFKTNSEKMKIVATKPVKAEIDTLVKDFQRMEKTVGDIYYHI
jgi:hypothetical protein